MKSWQRFSAKNKMVVYALAVLAVLTSAAVSVCAGAVNISLTDIVKIAFGKVRETPEANIILLARLPRTCGCLLAGAALAVSGAVIQSVLANPLAAPNVIGVNSGAGFAAALCAAAAPSAFGLTALAAFGGAFFSVMLVLAISKRSGASRITLVLAGVAVSAVFNAASDAVVTFIPDALNGYSDFRIGGFSNISFDRIITPAVIIAAAMTAVMLMTNELDVLSLGTETALSLGLNAGLMRVIFLAEAAALAGAAVSFAGLLGFVGLIVPNTVRRFTGGESKSLVLLSALSGAALVALCDTASRTLFAPYELPVGIVLSLAGGPFFIWILLRQRGGRIHD